MCGIAGELAFGAAADVAAVQRMADTMGDRGPDGAGSWSHDAVALAHRRLKIIDLSCAGDQPMTDPELGLTVVFNGCIYNHRELRAELERDGARFFSTSDTEVILKAYDRWGRDCVTHFKGMFAFAIYEHESRRLLLARDRLGVKPLYLADVDGALRFASTLPALLAGGGVDTELDPVALHHYLSWHAVVPAPYTILKGVRKLAPATTLLVTEDGERDERRYWEPDFGRQRALRRLHQAGLGRRGPGGDPGRGQAPDGGRRAGRGAAVRRPGLEPDRRAAGRLGTGEAGDVQHRLRRRRRARGQRVPLLGRDRRRVRHRPSPDPHRHRPDAAGARRRDQGDERADGLPRRGRVLSALAGGLEVAEGRAVGPGRRRGVRRLLLVSAAARRSRERRRRVPDGVL